MQPTMPDKTSILGVTISAVTMEETLHLIEQCILEKRRCYICLCTAHLLVLCHQDERLKSIVNAAGIAVADGMPLVYLLRRKGFKRVERIYGPDLLSQWCAYAEKKGYSQFLYGGQMGIPEALRHKLKNRFPALNDKGAYTHVPACLPEAKEKEVVEMINAAGADVVWVGWGSPLQERWMGQNRQAINAPVLIGVGAAFDFISGSKKQAPTWMRNRSLEWLFRLICEPRRLWKRYLIGNLYFVYLLFCEWRRRKRA